MRGLTELRSAHMPEINRLRGMARVLLDHREVVKAETPYFRSHAVSGAVVRRGSSEWDSDQQRKSSRTDSESYDRTRYYTGATSSSSHSVFSPPPPPSAPYQQVLVGPRG